MTGTPTKPELMGVLVQLQATLDMVREAVNKEFDTGLEAIKDIQIEPVSGPEHDALPISTPTVKQLLASYGAEMNLSALAADCISSYMSTGIIDEALLDAYTSYLPELRKHAVVRFYASVNTSTTRLTSRNEVDETSL